MTELKERIRKEKPLIIALCEMKPKNNKVRLELDYQIPGFTFHSINLNSDIGRCMAIYVHDSLEKSVTDIKPGVDFEEVCLLEIKLRGGDKMLFGKIIESTL